MFAQAVVRDAACFAIGQFAEYLQPTIIEHHAVVLPAVFACLKDASDKVKQKASYALECAAAPPSLLIPQGIALPPF